MGPFGDIVGLVLMIGGAVLAAVWFFVPFAIFGTKSRLDDLIDELEKTNKELADIKAILTRDPATNAVDTANATGAPLDEDMPSIRASR